MELKKKESSPTFRTTDSMKKKAHVVTRCFINLLKMFRLCSKKHKKNKGYA